MVSCQRWQAYETLQPRLHSTDRGQSMCTRLLHHFVSHQLLVLAAPTKLTFILLWVDCATAGLWLASIYSCIGPTSQHILLYCITVCQYISVAMFGMQYGRTRTAVGIPLPRTQCVLYSNSHVRPKYAQALLHITY